MKKNKIVFIIAGVLVLLTGLMSVKSLGVLDSFIKADTAFYEITPEEVINALETKSDMIIYYGQATCAACRNYEPILNQIALEEEIRIAFLDADIILNQSELVELHILETPTVIVIKDDFVHIYKGTMSENDTRKALKITNVRQESMDDVAELAYSELENKLQSNDEFFLYLLNGEDTNNIELFQEINKNVYNKKGTGLYFIDLNKLLLDDYDSIIKSFEYVDTVPIIYHIRNGIICSKYEYIKEVVDYLGSYDAWMEREMMYFNR